MANLSFWIPSSPIRHDYNLLVSRDLDGLTNEKWFPYHESFVSSSPIFGLTTNFPVEANGRSINYFQASSYFDDYYNRIHISPSLLAMGNVASEQVSTFNVWNAYLVKQSLQSISGIPEGINLSGQPKPILDFAALQERTYTVSVLPDGPATIEANINFQFVSETVTLTITGTRIIAFSWLIDWSTPVLEHISFLTDILQSTTGHEQRRALRVAPRLSFEADLLIYGAERQYFDLALTGWGARTFAMPLWPQQQWLKTAHAIGATTISCDTTLHNFRAKRLAVLRGATAFDNETVEIKEVLADRLILARPLQKAWPRGSNLAPAVTAQLNEPPQIIKRTDTMIRTHVTLNVTEPVDHAENLPTTLYRNYPVFDEQPNESEDLTHSHERLLAKLDNTLGLRLKTDLAKSAFGLYQFNWLTENRTQQNKMRSLFYALRGAQKAVWIPTHSNDLTVTQLITASSNTISIQWCGYSRFALNQLGRQDIRVQLRDGTVLYRRITAAAEINTSTERLELDQAFNALINIKDIVRISFMSLCRLSSDNITIEHINDSDGLAKCSVTWRGVRET